ncbi:MAG TPA: SRPBCC family protein [Gemmatimonadaceae bacterium]|nr:SRPBCC family protein [Gemmatimonadaceae bacterium]
MSTGIPLELGPMPASAEMRTVDERMVDAPLARIFRLAADVERWPALLPHYRYVRFVDRRSDGGGIVDMSANRPFGVVQWPTWWQSRMAVHAPGGSRPPSIRYTHIAGVTRGMEVEWTFEEMGAMTRVRIVHLWNGPPVPMAGGVAAALVIGPVFVHGIASRTLAGLADVAEQARLTG